MKNKNAFATLLSAVEKAKNGTPAQKSDTDFWRCEQDKAGNGFAIIRFLPAKSDDDVPFVKTYSHGFQGPAGKWFIEDCPTTIQKDCPVCTANGPLWATGAEKDKEIVRKRKRKAAYIANILVVSDPKNPDNEGKVFLFKFGQKIFDKIKDKIQPQFEDETPMNPFDADEGANFKLKMRKVEGYANYDKSEFEDESSIDNWKEVQSQLHDLNQFIDPKNFKSYDELEKKFNLIWGNAQPVKPVQTDDDDGDGDFVEKVVKAAKTKPAPAPKKVTESSDDDDDLAYFKSLAEED